MFEPSLRGVGNKANLVDPLVGEAYKLVRQVYQKLPFIEFVDKKIDNLDINNVIFRGNDETKTLEWKYENLEDWTPLITYAELIEGPLSEYLDSTNVLLNQVLAQLNDLPATIAFFEEQAAIVGQKAVTTAEQALLSVEKAAEATEAANAARADRLLSDLAIAQTLSNAQNAGSSAGVAAVKRNEAVTASGQAQGYASSAFESAEQAHEDMLATKLDFEFVAAAKISTQNDAAAAASSSGIAAIKRNEAVDARDAAILAKQLALDAKDDARTAANEANADRLLVDAAKASVDASAAQVVIDRDATHVDREAADGAATSAGQQAALAVEAATLAVDTKTEVFTARDQAVSANDAAQIAKTTSEAKALETETNKNIAVDKAQIATDKAEIATNKTAEALGYRDEAELAAVIATSNADASTSATNANLAYKQASEAAAATVGSYVGMYVDTTAGLAAVTDGKYFSTPGSSTAEYSILYRRTNSTTAQLIAKYPSSVSIGDILNAVVFGNPDGYVFTIMDGSKRAAIAIKEDGTFEVAKASIRTLEVIEALTQLQLKGYDLFIGDDALLTARYVKPGFLFDIQDVNGNTCVAIKEDGTLAVAALELLGGAVGAEDSGSNFNAEINHVIGNGQSLAEGHSSTPILTTVAQYDSLRFNGGVRAKDAGEADDTEKAAARASFVPLTEQVNGVLGESPWSGMAQAIKERIQAEYNLSHLQQNYQMLMSCPAEGGQTLSSLNTTYYHRVYNDIFYAHANSKTLGKSYRVQAMTWAQGEADDAAKTDPVTYKVALKAYIAKVNADVTNLTGQKTAIKFITYQPVSHEHSGFGMDGTPRTAIALAELAEENSNAYLACPNYMFPRAADNGHLTNVSSKWFGAYYGQVYQDVVINKKSWEPLKPTKIYFDDKIAMVEFHVPRPPLVFDTTIVAAHPTKGFRVVDSAGAEIPISSVSIINSKYVKILCTTAIPDGSYVQYAYKSESTASNRNGPINGPRGNLRDSRGDDVTVLIDGSNKRLDNWCILFSKKAT